MLRGSKSHFALSCHSPRACHFSLLPPTPPIMAKKEREGEIMATLHMHAHWSLELGDEHMLLLMAVHVYTHTYQHRKLFGLDSPKIQENCYPAH